MRRGLAPQDFKEQRSEPRTKCTRTIDLLPCTATREWKFLPAELTDCSLHGLGIILGEPLAPEHQFLVKLRVHGGVKLLIYTVHNCIPCDKSKFRIGARFSGFAAQEFDQDHEAVLNALIKES
jgi:hypothetical protein